MAVKEGREEGMREQRRKGGKQKMMKKRGD